MYPTLNLNLNQTGKRDVVYINRFANVKHDDIVVLDLRNNANFKSYVVKRLIASGGDVVNMAYDGNARQYNVIVNNEIVYSKPYKDFGYSAYDNFTQYINSHLDDASRILKDEYGLPQGVILKANEVFVMGDNWDVSKDSTLFGPFNKKYIVGRVDIVVKPNQNEFIQVLKRIF